VEFHAKTGAKLHRRGKPTIILTLETSIAQDEKPMISKELIQQICEQIP
jgi:hypothetical protein